MKRHVMLVIIGMILFFNPHSSFSQSSSFQKENQNSLTLSDILDLVEKRYDVPDFSAKFHQESILKAMEIRDLASGRIFIKRPSMMRWEYDTPDPQIIISNGNKLWIYRKGEHQVMVGKAPSFFGSGKGAGFLSDIKMLRKKFKLSMLNTNDNTIYKIKLIPLEETANLAKIFLSVSKNNFDITHIVTYNFYEDETNIALSEIKFGLSLDDDLFNFVIPEGADVVQIDE